MTESPLILTLGREHHYLEKLNRQARARGLNVVGASTREALSQALAEPRIRAVVVGGAIDPATRRAYTAMLDELRPDLPIHHHDLRDGEHAFIELIEAAAAEVDATDGPA